MIASARVHAVPMAAGTATPTPASPGAGLRPALLVGALFVFGASGAASVLVATDSERLFWIAADAAMVLAVLRGNRAPIRLAIDNPLLLAWPVLAIASALWSLTPGISLYHGVQLLATIMVGYFLCTLASPRQVLVILAAGLAAAQAASLAAVVLKPSVAIGLDGEWIGAFPHKNVLGSVMVLQILTCVALILDGTYRKTCLLLLGLAVLMLVRSRSGTALLACTIALAPLPLALLYRRGLHMFGAMVGIGFSAAMAVAWIVLGHGDDVAGSVLGVLGKDETLTGRTTLWQFGIDQVGHAPWLGVGYKAYWESAATSAAYLRYVINQDLWFFHNNFVDVTVAFGFVGLALFCAGLVASVRRVLVVFAARPTFINLWRLMFVLYALVEATAENPLFQNHSLQQLLFAVATAVPLRQIADVRGAAGLRRTVHRAPRAQALPHSATRVVMRARP